MKQRGFMFVDALIGMMVLGVAAAMLATAVGGANRAGRSIEANRHALRVASETLLLLQTRSATDPTAGVTILPLDTPAAPGWRWVRVRVTQDQGRAELIGLVPGSPP